MAIFKLRWLRRLLRKNFNMPEPTAEKWHRRMTFAYVILAWNALGAVAFMAKSGKYDYAQFYGLKTEVEARESKVVSTMHTLGIPKARVVTVKGMSVVRDEVIENEILEEQVADRDKNLKIDQ